MEEDNLLPNDGTYFGVPVEPKEQVLARRKERAQVLQAVTVLKEVITRMETQIDYFEKNSSVPDEVRLDPQQFLIMSNSYKLAAESLTAEKEWLQQLIDDNAR